MAFYSCAAPNSRLSKYTKGAFAKTLGTTGEYTLTVSGIKTVEEITVTVRAKSGYVISPLSNKVDVHIGKSALETVEAVQGVQGEYERTTQLRLKFSKSVPLTADPAFNLEARHPWPPQAQTGRLAAPSVPAKKRQYPL